MRLTLRITLALLAAGLCVSQVGAWHYRGQCAGRGMLPVTSYATGGTVHTVTTHTALVASLPSTALLTGTTVAPTPVHLVGHNLVSTPFTNVVLTNALPQTTFLAQTPMYYVVSGGGATGGGGTTGGSGGVAPTPVHLATTDPALVQALQTLNATNQTMIATLKENNIHLAAQLAQRSSMTPTTTASPPTTLSSVPGANPLAALSTLPNYIQAREQLRVLVQNGQGGSTLANEIWKKSLADYQAHKKAINEMADMLGIPRP